MRSFICLRKEAVSWVRRWKQSSSSLSMSFRWGLEGLEEVDVDLNSFVR